MTRTRPPAKTMTAKAAPLLCLCYLALFALPQVVLAIPAAAQQQQHQRDLERRTHTTFTVPSQTTVTTTYTTVFFSTTVTRPESVQGTTTIWVTRTESANADALGDPSTTTRTITTTVTAGRKLFARVRGRQDDGSWTPDASTATPTFDDGLWTPDASTATPTFDDGFWTPSATTAVTMEAQTLDTVPPEITPTTPDSPGSTKQGTESAVATPTDEDEIVTVTDTATVETIWDSTWRDITQTFTVTSSTVTSGYTTTTRFTTTTLQNSTQTNNLNFVTWVQETATVQPAPDSPPQVFGRKPTNKGAIAGGVVGVVVLAALIVGICVLMRRRNFDKERQRRREEKMRSVMSSGGALGGYTAVSGGSHSHRPEVESLMGNVPPGVGVGDEHYSLDDYPKTPTAASNTYGPLSPSPPLDSSNLPPVPINWRSPSPTPTPIPATPTIIPPSSSASIYTTNSPTAAVTGSHLFPRPAPVGPTYIAHHHRSGSLAENIMPPPLPPPSERSSSGGSVTLYGSDSERGLSGPPGNGAAPPRRTELTVRRKSVPPPEESHLLSRQGGGPSSGGGAHEGSGGQYYW